MVQDCTLAGTQPLGVFFGAQTESVCDDIASAVLESVVLPLLMFFCALTGNVREDIGEGVGTVGMDPARPLTTLTMSKCVNSLCPKYAVPGAVRKRLGLHLLPHVIHLVVFCFSCAYRKRLRGHRACNSTIVKKYGMHCYCPRFVLFVCRPRTCARTSLS